MTHSLREEAEETPLQDPFEEIPLLRNMRQLPELVSHGYMGNVRTSYKLQIRATTIMKV